MGVTTAVPASTEMDGGTTTDGASASAGEEEEEESLSPPGEDPGGGGGGGVAGLCWRSLPPPLASAPLSWRSRRILDWGVLRSRGCIWSWRSVAVAAAAILTLLF